MDDLSSSLTHLKDCVGNVIKGGGNSTNNIKIKTISAELCSYITDDLDPADLPLVSHHLVGGVSTEDEDTDDSDANNNLLDVARSVAKEKELADFLRDVCEIFSCLIIKYPDKFSHKVAQVKSFCTTVFFTNPSSKARVEAIALLEVCFDR